MIAKFELRSHNNGEKVWIGRYQNLGSLPHFHHECELLYLEEGDGVITIGKNVYSLKPGEGVFILPGEVHSVKTSKNSKILVCLYLEEIKNKVSLNKTIDSPVIVNIDNHYSLLLDLLKCYKEKEEYYVLEMENIMSNIVINLFRQSNLKEVKKSYNERIDSYKHLLEEIDKRYVDITFDDAAKIMNYSRSYFSRFFNQLAGMNFQYYLNHIKIEKAIEMVNENPEKPMTDIALEVGFSTIRNFNRLFKKYTGYAPSQLPNDFNYTFRHITKLEEHFDPTESKSILL